ncbi:MAG: hypothetical protein A2Z34_00720 [Planctomycetes bacterium RBG_16_59_8]|nr:MAG: hypothetical protein A2Z34_00720 [Planctomycetes bacterium RBG_16_59_8]
MPVIKARRKETPTSKQAALSSSTKELSRPDLQRILAIRMNGIVVLAKKDLPVNEILSLKHGSIIEFEKAVKEPLTLEVNGKEVATGTAVKIGEKFGVRIVDVIPVDSKLKAMAQASAKPAPPEKPPSP